MQLIERIGPIQSIFMSSAKAGNNVLTQCHIPQVIYSLEYVERKNLYSYFFKLQSY